MTDLVRERSALTTSVILIIIALLEASYRHGRRTLWLFKLVRRDNGRFIIGNASLLWPATVCAEFAVFLPYLLAMKSIYVDRSDPASAYYWRCLTTYVLSPSLGAVCSGADV